MTRRDVTGIAPKSSSDDFAANTIRERQIATIHVISGIMIFEHNPAHWHITSKDGLPEVGTCVWFCHYGRLTRAVYVGPGRWLNPTNRQPYFEGFTPAYWITESEDYRVPLAPGHDADYARPNTDQGLLIYTTGELEPWLGFYNPIEGIFGIKERGVWKMFTGVRFWKTTNEFEADLNRSVCVTDPQTSLNEKGVTQPP